MASRSRKFHEVRVLHLSKSVPCCDVKGGDGHFVSKNQKALGMCIFPITVCHDLWSLHCSCSYRPFATCHILILCLNWLFTVRSYGPVVLHGRRLDWIFFFHFRLQARDSFLQNWCKVNIHGVCRKSLGQASIPGVRFWTSGATSGARMNLTGLYQNMPSL